MYRTFPAALAGSDGRSNGVRARKMRSTIVIACRVMQELLETILGKDIRRVYMDILLHNTPKKLAAALQAEIDAIAEPSNIIIGYGLCGNGLVGVRDRANRR